MDFKVGGVIPLALTNYPERTRLLPQGKLASLICIGQMMDMMVREEVIMELTKYRSKEVLAHIRHDMRQLPSGKTYGNEAIDMSLSKGNYSLISRGKTPQEVNAYRKKLEKEI